jgi:hypothetical protein
MKWRRRRRRGRQCQVSARTTWMPMPTAMRVTCLCPGEATLYGSVGGTDTYTADSATCRAAVHAGMIAQSGGTVSVQMLPGQARYPGTTLNGVQSSNVGCYEASYRCQGDPRMAKATAPVQASVAESLQRTGHTRHRKS